MVGAVAGSAGDERKSSSRRRDLTKRYGGTAVVNGISFTVARGEIFGLLGPNGAGKTTTILMLLGLSDITDGTARVLGHDPVREPLAVKRRVGYMPDRSAFTTISPRPTICATPRA